MLVLIAFLTSCKDEIVPESYKPRNEHDAYRYSLEQANLLSSALGKEWLSSSNNALENPIKVEAPYKEAFYLDPNKAESSGYRFSVKRGQKIEVEVTVLDFDSMQVFIDLYRIDNDSLRIWKHVASADSINHFLAFEPRRDADYLLRVQPELLRGGRFGITVQKVPSFTFPVVGKNSRAIGSYFGDPRDGGRREHHGVDIFAKRHTPIIAPTRAYVRFVGERGIGGNVVWLRDSKGHNLYFAHLQIMKAKPRTYVNPGDTIGTVGNSGNARTTPTHLHFGIYRNGPIDPIHFIKETNTRLPSLESDLNWLGTWMRVNKITNLSTSETDGIVIDTLNVHQLIKIIGAVDSRLRVALPNGQLGYLHQTNIESSSSPVSRQTVATSTPILSQPDSGSLSHVYLDAGDSLEVIGRQDEYFFVRTPEGKTGWTSSL